MTNPRFADSRQISPEAGPKLTVEPGGRPETLVLTLSGAEAFELFQRAFSSPMADTPSSVSALRKLAELTGAG